VPHRCRSPSSSARWYPCACCSLFRRSDPACDDSSEPGHHQHAAHPTTAIWSAWPPAAALLSCALPPSPC
jgi:hypothetical protein